MSGWTDERVELLKKLWQDGLSASQIAKQLGGVTRNAVIGKVHRLGLSGRATPSKPARTTFKAPRPARPVTAAPSAPRRISSEPVSLHAPPTPVRYVDEAPGTATVLTLGAHMCKWPIGRTEDPDFSFCGAHAPDGPYCTTVLDENGRSHRDRAHQPSTPSKRAAEPLQSRAAARFGA
jgi:GcrA cell cycle regulator